MNTPYESIISKFFRRIEKDRRFFKYCGLDEYASMALAKERAAGLLDEAVSILSLKGNPTVDFSDRDDYVQEFGFELTGNEIYLLSSIMYLQYLERDFSYLKTLSVNYTDTSLRVFDPSNARSTFLSIYTAVKEEVDGLIDVYKNTDRNTGGYLGVDFDSYDTED